MPHMYAWFDPDASDVYLDDTHLPFEADDVQEGFEKLVNLVAISASPGFTWGRSGALPKNTWLLNDTVPSNNSGREVFLYNAHVETVYVANYDPQPVSFSIYYHSGASVGLTFLGTVTTGAVRSQDFPVYWAVPKGQQLAIKVDGATPNSGKEAVVGILLKGTIIP
jgi:hypothetical protein